MIVDLLLLYEITNVFFYVKETLCKESIFVDTINIGMEKEENEQTHWIGVQNLPLQVNIFTDESTLAKQKY